MVVNPPGFQWPHCVPKHDDMDVDTEANEDLLIWAETLILDISADCLPEKGLIEVTEASQIQSLVEIVG
ncbi:hypothetical protein M0R45_009025 [Rubus argutus]|uniref:Uncharacterized protein n=1 Tax=Rubus argutus TaxID=59490 RepID=A0AAW1Y303_RUBAR